MDKGVFVHPSYQHTGYRYDIALVQLATPFGPEGEADEAAAADAWGRVMTAALPRASLPVGRPGTIVKNRGTEPAGYTPIVTAAPDSPAEAGQFHLYPAAGSICKGDSGSGVFEIVNGRATVVGVASTAVVRFTDRLPARAGGEVGVTDVFSYRSWIYATMGMTADQVDGQVRLRWSGASSTPGYMSLQCQSERMTPVEAPMNVPGSELSMDCAKVRVYCAPEGVQPGPLQLHRGPVHLERWGDGSGGVPVPVERGFHLWAAGLPVRVRCRRQHEASPGRWRRDPLDLQHALTAAVHAHPGAGPRRRSGVGGDVTGTAPRSSVSTPGAIFTSRPRAPPLM